MATTTIAGSTSYTATDRGQYVFITPSADFVGFATFTPASGPVVTRDLQPSVLHTYGSLVAGDVVAITVYRGTARVETDVEITTMELFQSLRTSAYGTATQGTFAPVKSGLYYVRGTGGGGGGGGGHTASGGGGGGGGAGAQVGDLFPVYLLAGTTYYYQIGGGGAGGAAGSNGTAGSDTYIRTTSHAGDYVFRFRGGNAGSLGNGTNGGAGGNGFTHTGGATGTGTGASGNMSTTGNATGFMTAGMIFSGGGGGAGGGPSSAGGSGGDNVTLTGGVTGGSAVTTNGGGGGGGTGWKPEMLPSTATSRGAGGSGSANGQDASTAYGCGGGGGGCQFAGGRGGDGFMDIYG